MNLTSCQIEDAELDNTELVKNFIEITYNYGNGFRTRNQECLFLAKDVAEWIEYSGRTGQLLNTVDEDEKLMNTIYASGQRRQMWFLTEDGLYEVLMQSRMPIAKAFKKEVKKLTNSKVNIIDFKKKMQVPYKNVRHLIHKTNKF